MKLFLTLLFILVILFVVQCFTGTTFRASFWPNLLADLIVAVVFGLMLDQLTNLTKRPYLIMVIKQGRFYSDTIKWTKAVDGQFETSFRIAIKNKGNKMLKPGEGYWHLYVPGASEVKHVGGADQFASPDRDHLRDLINLPIFPHSFLDVGPEFTWKTNDVAKFPIHYFFDTEYGYFPKTVEMNNETAEVLFTTIGTFPTKIS